jgi:hypothetical protein
MTPPTLRPLTVGEILDTSFSLYRHHFGALATVALVCTGVPLALRLFLEAGGGFLANLPLAFLYTLSLVVLNLIATGATVFVVSESYGPADLGPSYRRSTRTSGGSWSARSSWRSWSGWAFSSSSFPASSSAWAWRSPFPRW